MRLSCGRFARYCGASLAILVLTSSVRGAGSDPTVTQSVYAWDTRAFEENRQLIEWMRRHNSTRVAPKIRFYGIDLTGGRQGQFRDSRRSADEALAFVDRVASPGRLSPRCGQLTSACGDSPRGELLQELHEVKGASIPREL
jgi:erythromycin esterase-like protein